MTTQAASSFVGPLTAAQLDEQPRATITATRPENGATNVPRDVFIAADINLPTTGAGISTSSINSSTVRLYRTSDGQPVPAVTNTSGGGDALVLQPANLLEANTQYTFEVTSGLKDVTGTSFVPYSMTFTTGAVGGEADDSIAFERVALPTATMQSFSGVTIGPDNRLYATALSGHIFRYDIASDGTLSEPFIIQTIRKNNGGKRFVTGLVFDPWSTRDNLVAYVTHGESAYDGADDWTGKVSELMGPELATYRDFVVGLPRSIRDHMTNQPSFGPDGKMYFPQGSNTAMGAPDNTWGLREEHPLTAAVLTLDHRAARRRLNAGLGPLDVSGNYDPRANDAPLKIYATGVRSAYDLLWHSNGNLYAPTNGSAAGGNTPATPKAPFSIERIDGTYTGPEVPALNNVRQTQNDFLYHIVPGGYYGHPNPTRGEFVLNGGNPSGIINGYEVAAYPVGTQADRNYRGAAFNFGQNRSPNGIIEYKSNTFGGKLKGQILLVRYSGGDDIIALEPSSSGTIIGSTTNIRGLTHFVDPLDLVEDTRNGNLYVVEHGAGRLTLLRPGDPGIKTNTARRIFSEIRGSQTAGTKRVNITNTGGAPLVIPANGITIQGPDASQFEIVGLPTGERVIEPGKTIGVSIAFKPPGGTAPGIKTAELVIQSNDTAQPTKTVRLRGLATTGVGGTHEPSLARILELYEIPINVGDSNPSSVFLDLAAGAQTDEVVMQRMTKAAVGPVTIEPLAVYGVAGQPTVEFGHYQPGSPQTKTDVFSVGISDAQTATPHFNGASAFEPRGATFSLYASFPKFRNTDGTTREVYSEDALNRWEPVADNRRKMRFYPLKDAKGTVVPNAYVVALEEFTSGYDYQDVVAIIRNIRPAAAGPRLGLFNRDTVPFHDRLVFNRIQNLDKKVPNVVHDAAQLRLDNTGTSTLTINELSISGPWQLVSAPQTPFTIAPGASRDLTVRFTATGGAVHHGSLTIKSNDVAQPNRTVQLAGYWQFGSEEGGTGRSLEPTIQQIGEAFGYTTAFTYGSQSIDTGGRVEAVGDEVISAYWMPVEVSKPVEVTQLAAFHQQGETATLSYFAKGSVPNPTKIFTHLAADGQSFLPRTDQPGRFFATGRFGFKVDNEWSDPTKNGQEQPGGGYGHHFRFFPARDRAGAYIDNTWIMIMDYQGINYDFNDNIYLVSNIRPETMLAAPAGAVAMGSSKGIQLRWADTQDSTLAGYYVSRAMRGTGKYERISAMLTSPSFLDEDASPDRTWHYRITAVDITGVESVPTSVSAYRPVG